MPSAHPHLQPIQCTRWGLQRQRGISLPHRNFSFNLGQEFIVRIVIAGASSSLTHEFRVFCLCPDTPDGLPERKAGDQRGSSRTGGCTVNRLSWFGSWAVTIHTETPTPYKRHAAQLTQSLLLLTSHCGIKSMHTPQGNPQLAPSPDSTQRQGFSPATDHQRAAWEGTLGLLPILTPHLSLTQIVPFQTAGIIFCPLISQPRVSPQLHTFRYKIRIDVDTRALP